MGGGTLFNFSLGAPYRCPLPFARPLLCFHASTLHSLGPRLLLYSSLLPFRVFTFFETQVQSISGPNLLCQKSVVVVVVVVVGWLVVVVGDIILGVFVTKLRTFVFQSLWLLSLLSTRVREDTFGDIDKAFRLSNQRTHYVRLGW